VDTSNEITALPSWLRWLVLANCIVPIMTIDVHRVATGRSLT
jgi:hypothetical protein